MSKHHHHHDFAVGETVYYGSLGHGVKFKIEDRCVSGKWVLKTVESNQDYAGGWTPGRLMLADEGMLAHVEHHHDEHEDGERFTREQVQAMVNRTYGLALNDASCEHTNPGSMQPWQKHIPKVKTLRRDLIAAGTWPCTKEEWAEILREVREPELRKEC